MFAFTLLRYLEEQNVFTNAQTKELSESIKCYKSDIIVPQHVVSKQNEFLNDIAENHKDLDRELTGGRPKKQADQMPGPSSDYILLSRLCSEKYGVTPDQFSEFIRGFQEDYHLSEPQLELLIRNDLPTYIDHVACVPDEDLVMKDYITLFVRVLLKFTDPHLVLGKIQRTGRLAHKFITFANCVGDHEFCIGFTFDDYNIKIFAEKHAEQFVPSMDKSIETSVINYFNSVVQLYLTYMFQKRHLPLDMEDIACIQDKVVFTDNAIWILPVYISFGTIHILFIQDHLAIT